MTVSSGGGRAVPGLDGPCAEPAGARDVPAPPTQVSAPDREAARTGVLTRPERLEHAAAHRAAVDAAYAPEPGRPEGGGRCRPADAGGKDPSMAQHQEP